MKKIKKNESIIAEIEKVNENEKLATSSPKFQKKGTTKFSMSNENEFLFNSRERNRSNKKAPFLMSNPKPSASIKKIYECKAKSEEKYSGSPAYQIFMAKHPAIQINVFRFNSSLEKKTKTNNFVASPPESASLRRFKKESLDNFDDFRERPKVIHNFQFHEENERRIAAAAKNHDNEFMENTSKYHIF